MEISFIRIWILIAVGTVVFSVVKSLFINKNRIPKGVKPLPGPKGSSIRSSSRILFCSWLTKTPGLPVIGNALDIPKSHAWFKFKEWADEHGPIYQVNAFGTTLVIISKESIANELLSLRGAIYSDRPALIMPALISDNGFLGAMGWTDYWRRARRFAQSMLATTIVQQSVPKQTTEARQMVVDLAKNPSRYAYWLERAGVMTSIKQIYGLSEQRGAAEEHHVHEICAFMEEIERVATPGQYLVEFIPWLMYLPDWLAPFKREAQTLVKRHWDYLEPLVRRQSEKYDHSNHGVQESPESFARRYLKSKDDWGISDREIVWVLSSIYGGASGTSATAMQSIILNLCLYPEWQRRIQKEIDEVVGDDNARMPNFDDFSQMPTVRAVIKESMRWRPVLSGGTYYIPQPWPSQTLLVSQAAQKNQMNGSLTHENGQASPTL